MKPLDQLKAIINNKYQSDEGSFYSLELIEGMTDDEIESFQSMLPRNKLPEDIKDLLRYARGIEFGDFGPVHFDALGVFGFEAFFPQSIQLAGDGFGNFWILDIGLNGEWKEVYYVCHDPPVIVKHSKNLQAFIEHIDEFGRLGEASHLNIIHDQIVGDIWKEPISILEKNDKDYQFPKEFVLQLPKSFMIADLTDQPIKTGFNWAKYGANAKVVRFQDRAIWIIEKKYKQSFLSRLFHWIKA